MKDQRWLYFALGITTVISVGAVANQLVPLAPAMGLALNDSGITFPDGTVQTTAAPRDPRRLFYLTTSTHQGGPGATVGPLEACGTGFHMASLWELADVGTLSYDFKNPNAITSADSGEGPPTGIGAGWIRTGNISSPSSETDVGRANCSAWSTLSGNGTLLFLPTVWSDSAGGGSVLTWGTPWTSAVVACDIPIHHVWCAEDYPGAADVGCVGEDTFACCNDGVDNDGDTYVDCEDFDCAAFCP